MMKINVFDTPEKLAEESARAIAVWIARKPDSLCCFAAGFTQNDTYAALARIIREQQIPTDQLRLIGLDEWGGLNGSDPGSCRAYMDERLLAPLGINPSQILLFFDGKADMREQCEQADQLLDQHGPIDILVLGLGMNGHIGFNEPGDDRTLRSHFHRLDDTTVTVGGKYFNAAEAPKQGVTLGLGDLLQSRRIMLQAVGAHKAPVVRTFLNAPVLADCPATFLRDTDARIYLDEAANAG